MTLLSHIVDGLLGLGLLWLAWQALASPDLFRAIVLFIAFGLLMSLAWVRLDAPDVALAEAAIGAGLTGALMLSAFAKLKHPVTGDASKNSPPTRRQWWPVAVLLFVITGLGYSVVTLPYKADGLSTEVATHLTQSGVSNPVTAVLLNFRGYDTLLEMAVLLLVLMGAWALNIEGEEHSAAPVVLEMFSRLLTPVLFLMAAYLLWVGAHAPGGAFQAGSVLGAAGVLMMLSGWRPGGAVMALPLRLVLIAGTAVFVVMAVITLLMEGSLLEYPPAYAGTLILVIETAATISIGAILAALFLGRRPRETENQ